jgi:hypothetical protein
MTTPARLAALVTALVLLVPGTALAESASITVTTSAGASDPVAFVPRIFTVSGTSTGAKYLFVKHRAAGGSPCAPSAYTDPGSSWTGFYNLAVNGAFSFPKAVTWDATGSWMFCFWLASDERGIVFPTSQTVGFRAPFGSMAGSVTPAVVRPDRAATFTITGTSEAPRYLFAKVRLASIGPCATTYDTDSGVSLISGENVDGSFTGRGVTIQPAPGQYLICAWLAGYSDDPRPIVVQPTTFPVQASPPVLSSASVLNCATRTSLRSFRADTVRSVCMRYRFSTPPYAGQRLLVSYVTPARKTYKTVAAKWPTGGAKAGITPALLARAYKHRRGTWRAILRIAGKQVKVTTFRVT